MHLNEDRAVFASWKIYVDFL